MNEIVTLRWKRKYWEVLYFYIYLYVYGEYIRLSIWKIMFDLVSKQYCYHMKEGNKKIR